ncbi:hypothetical protein [Nocardia sp. NPDC050175]
MAVYLVTGAAGFIDAKGELAFDWGQVAPSRKVIEARASIRPG